MADTPWFATQRLEATVTRRSEPHVHKYFGANFFSVVGADANLLIDFGMGLVPLRPALDLRAGKPVVALATHIHADHGPTMSAEQMKSIARRYLDEN